MRKTRRQIINRIAEGIALGAVVLSLVTFFAIYRPLGNEVAAAERHHSGLRQRIRDQQVRVELLKKYQEDLPHAGEGVQEFLANRIPPRREAYSITDHLIHKGADAASVKVTGMIFRLETEHKAPLQRLGFEINVQGPYPGLLKFSHALETASNIVLVRDFTLSPVDNGMLNLRLIADLYLTP
jgi:Tfp pilus assembly protein PilO